MNISKQTIQDIKNRVAPEQVIEYYTGVQGSHNRYLCPFHNDRHPSISVKGQRWTCWACGASGDIIDFTKQYFGIGFRDAVVKLGKDFGIPVEAEATGTPDPAELEKKLLAEISRKNHKEHSEWINDRINTLTICRRLLMQHGAPAWEIDIYDRELDKLL